MAKKVSTATLRSIQKQVDSEIVNIGEVDGNQIEMRVKKRLPLGEFLEFVNSAATWEWFASEDEIGVEEYKPSFSKARFAVEVVKRYTDVNLPSKFEEAYAVAMWLYEDVLDVVGDTEQFRDLVAVIELAQEHEREKRSGLNGLFIGLIQTLNDKVKDFDINKILAELKGFSPEQLDNFSVLKEMADAFTKPRYPGKDNVVEFPQKDGAVPDANISESE